MMKVRVGMFVEPDEEHRNYGWARGRKWPLEVESLLDDPYYPRFYLKGIRGTWSTTGLQEYPASLENK